MTKFAVAPFIATLGMMYIARGAANLVSNGATFPNLVGKEALGNTGFEIFGRDIMGFPVAVISCDFKKDSIWLAHPRYRW